MEKTRVPHGCIFWTINSFGEVVGCRENNCIDFEKRFIVGNYFNTREEAETIAHKIRAVLKGVEMIESPKAVLAFNDFLAKLNDAGIISYDKGCEYMKEFQSKIAK